VGLLGVFRRQPPRDQDPGDQVPVSGRRSQVSGGFQLNLAMPTPGGEMLLKRGLAA
jgi:hypothetical protein